MDMALLESACVEIAEYNPVEAGLAELRRKYHNVVVDVSTPHTLAEARRVRAEIRDPRYETEKIRKMLKAPALAHARLIDTEAARITAALLEIEIPWDDAIKAQEERLASERQARAAAERSRVSAIHARIGAIKDHILLALECRSAAQVEGLLGDLSRMNLTGFDEFGDEAATAHLAAMKRVEAILVEKHQAEQEQVLLQAELRAQTERLATQQKALDRQRLEVDFSPNAGASRAEPANKTPSCVVPGARAVSAVGSVHAAGSVHATGSAPATLAPATLALDVRGAPLAPGFAMAPLLDTDPTPHQILGALSDYFGVTRAQVVVWLKREEFQAVLQ